MFHNSGWKGRDDRSDAANSFESDESTKLDECFRLIRPDDTFAQFFLRKKKTSFSNISNGSFVFFFFRWIRKITRLDQYLSGFTCLEVFGSIVRSKMYDLFCLIRITSK